MPLFAFSITDLTTFESIPHEEWVEREDLFDVGNRFARTMLAASDLIAGRLVRPFRTAITLRNTYWIVCPRATGSLPKIVAFREWLLGEVAADRQRLARAERGQIQVAAARTAD